MRHTRPLPEASGPVTPERMQDILTRNSYRAKPAPKTDAGSVTNSAPASAPGSLEWQKPVATGPGTAIMHSQCGSYRIDRVGSQLSVGYTCWKLRAAEQGLHQRLGRASSREEAIALCEAAR